MTDYKFRAECMHDVQELYNIVNFRDSVTNFIVTLDSIGLPDVDVSFTSTLSAEEICLLMDTIPDTHVAIESLDVAENYTGERFRDFEDCNHNEINLVVKPEKIPDSCISDPRKVWPNQDYIDFWLGSLEHQLKFCDQNSTEVIGLKQEIDKIKSISCDSIELFDSHISNLRTMINQYLDTLPDDDSE
ncbi:MAG: hypothetical protein WD512_08215 [Candidatus Paceibacterota bacterium]